MTNESLETRMLKQYGPLIGGEDLWKALGFKTWAAFARADRLGKIGVNIIKVHGRRGRFALTTDLAKWLEEIGRNKR